ncbi:hypothetical protein ACTHQ8_20285 [Lysinibacillus odysseyi]|nr:hypothetical protein [Lysinibacillus odysseyi]
MAALSLITQQGLRVCDNGHLLDLPALFSFFFYAFFEQRLQMQAKK